MVTSTLSIEQFKFDLSERQITKLKCSELTSKLLSGDAKISNEDFKKLMNELNENESSLTTNQENENTDDDEKINLLPICHLSEDGTKQISVETINKLLNDKKSAFADNFDHFMIIDCRYGYEYNGGHIDGAFNINDKNLLHLLFKINSKYFNTKKIALIFHCEYSQKRGPRSAAFIRNLDRKENALRYPNLYFPHVYVIFGGYNKYHHNENNIKSTTYISMFDEKYVNQKTISSKFEHESWLTSKTKSSASKSVRCKKTKGRRRAIRRRALSQSFSQSFSE